MSLSTPSFSSPLRLAVTLGDPAGIGPEIVVRLFADGFGRDDVAPFVVGEKRHLEQAAQALGLTSILPSIPVVEPPDFHFEGPLEQGKVSAQCGAAAWAYIRHAVYLVQTGQADGIVTAPLQKEALQAAGCPYPGHTEMLAALAGDAKVAMLLVGGGVRVALATIHEPVTKVPELLTREGLLENLRLLNSFIPWFGVPRPVRIGVTGLNPHAGEGGMFGDEEERIIAPAIADARAEGINAVGPLPGDTVFHFHREGAYDAVLAMYHDQGLIPVKTLAFHDGVNVTMGLPFIRTSVDHGTAFDIAGKGIARPDSLRAALHCAATLVRNRV
jgi:4-hydroxythreonine-4-phosphate dehydrogenase